MIRKTFALASIASLFLLSAASAQINSPERFVQINSVDLVNAVVELRNFGSNVQALDGWRFCSHDENEVRRYTGTTGFNGMSMQPGTSLFVHLNNDATGADAINGNSLGGLFAMPFDQFPATGGSYAIAIYSFAAGGGFGNGANIADHIQFSYNGVDNASADDRSDEAEAGGVWSDQNAWISVDADTEAITLNAGAENTENSSPSDYTVVQAETLEEVAPTAVTVFRGLLVAGGLNETLQSDDMALQVNPGFTLNSTEAPVWIIHDGNLSEDSPVALDVQVEARANTPGLTQTMEAFNWLTGVFDEVDSRAGSFNTDVVATVDLSANVPDYVEAGTGAVRVRNGWRQTGFVLLFPWQIDIDQVGWTAEF